MAVDRPFVEAPIAPLAEVLRYVEMSGIFYCPSILTEPWGLELPPMRDCVWFHAVTDGSATMEVEGERVTLRTGDFVLVPHGAGHRAWGATEAPTPSVFDLPHEYFGDRFAVLRHGGDPVPSNTGDHGATSNTGDHGATSNIVCGGIRFDHAAARHLVEALPAVIRIEASRTTRSDWIRTTIDLIAEEVRHVRPGGEAVISRLCDIVVIQAIRAWIESDPAARSGWLGAMHDEHLGAALAAVHADPGAEWSVASLARTASMSRSTFAARFTEMVGEPAMAYVARWRMYRATELLHRGELSVAGVAQQVGYDSEAAFSRAYKRIVGVSPGTARRANRTEA